MPLATVYVDQTSERKDVGKSDDHTEVMMSVRQALYAPVICLVVGSCTLGTRHPVEQIPTIMPQELVGVWAPLDTDLREDGNPVKGEVLYLTSHGTGATIGSGPPPIGGVFLASYDARSSFIYYLTLGTGHHVWQRLVYDPVKQTIVTADAPQLPPSYRRSKMIPREVTKKLGPELWNPEHARLRDFVREMDLYFPRLGYGGMPRLEQIVNRGNLFREEALDLLRFADEVPISSLGKDSIEVYRLIWVADSRQPSPFVVRVQRNQHGRVSLATTWKGEKSGDTITRRRELEMYNWVTLKKCLETAKYYDLPVRIEGPKSDHGWWIVEGWREGICQYVEACSPVPGPYREICELFMGLAGIDPKIYSR